MDTCIYEHLETVAYYSNRPTDHLPNPVYPRFSFISWGIKIENLVLYTLQLLSMF